MFLRKGKYSSSKKDNNVINASTTIEGKRGYHDIYAYLVSKSLVLANRANCDI